MQVKGVNHKPLPGTAESVYFPSTSLPHYGHSAQAHFPNTS